MTRAVKIVVNGAAQDVDEGTTVAAVVRSVTDAPSGVAVARNDAVVPRAAWESTLVHADDRIEILTAVQGG